MQEPITTDPPFIASAKKRMEDIQIGQLVLAPEEAKFFHRITAALLRSSLSVGDFLALSPAKLSNLNGVGTRYIEQLPTLQFKMPLWGMRHWAAQWHAVARSLILNEVSLPTDIRKSLEKLLRHQGNNLSSAVSASTPLSINFFQLAETPGWGKASIDSLKTLSQAVAQGLGGRLEFEEASAIPDLFQDPAQFETAEDIDEQLSATISSFLQDISDPRHREILEVRLGLGRPKETLEQLGGRMKAIDSEKHLTRERVRQIEKRSSDQLKKAFSVLPDMAIFAGKPYPTSKLAHGLPKTSALFFDNETFIDFMAMWSGRTTESLRCLEPEACMERLYSYCCTHSSPLTETELIEALRENPDEPAESCREKLASLEAAGLMKRSTDGGWTPVRLPIEVAIPHLFLSAQEGLHWQEAMEIIRDLDLLGDDFPLERTFQTRVQGHPMLFLYGVGIYRHRAHHELTGTAGRAWIRFVKSRLGEEAVNFRFWFHHKARLHEVINYFELRDLLNRHGEEEGVYFFGQSRRETVALAPDAPSTPNEAVLIEFLEGADRPLNRREIEEGLFFIPASTISLKLSELVESGKIKKVGPTHWGKIF